MNFPPLELLGSSNETSAFLLLLWRELFEGETPDTFRPRHQNIPALVREISEVAALSLEHSAWKQHLSELHDELAVSIAENGFLLEPFPRYLWSLKDLLSLKDPRQIGQHALLLSEESPPSIEFYQRNLIRALEKMPKEKGDLIVAVNNLATFAAGSGRQHEELFNLARDALFPRTPDEAVAELCAICNPLPDRYRFIIAIEGDRRRVAKVVERYPAVALVAADEPRTEQVQDFLNRHSTCAFVSGDVEASGPVDAAKRSLRAIRPMADLLNFFRNELTLIVREEVLVTRTNGATECIEVADQSLQRLLPRNRAEALTIRALKLAPSQMQGRLVNALELHSLAQGSAAPRVRLVNLWTAVECLLGTRNADSIIEHAAALIGPLMAWNRVAKVTKYLAISVRKYTDYGASLPRDCGFDNSKRSEVQAADLLAILTKPRGHPHPDALAKFVAPHVLLRFRLFKAWQNFCNPANLREELRGSQKRVRWQLFRIYRARNMSVHHGEDVQMSSTLLDTLHYYFSFLLSRILAALGRNRTWNLDEALTSLSREARYVQHNLQFSARELLIRDFLPDAKARATEFVWPPPSPAPAPAPGDGGGTEGRWLRP